MEIALGLSVLVLLAVGMFHPSDIRLDKTGKIISPPGGERKSGGR